MGCTSSREKEDVKSKSSGVNSGRSAGTDSSKLNPKAWNWDSAASANTHLGGQKTDK